MSLISFRFLIFFAVVFAAYWFPPVRRRVRLQNAWLLATSWLFYVLASWDTFHFSCWKVLVPMVAASALFYFLGLWVARAVEAGKMGKASALRAAGVVSGVGILVVFRCLGVFVGSLSHLLAVLGVSFYTFRLISYVIDVYRGTVDPERGFIDFALYVSFFPSILSGPIDRPGKFLPQLKEAREFDYPLAVDGCRQILWGLFTKMCIADNLALFTNDVWSSIGDHRWLTIWSVAALYPLQMYADFDGYSNIAIGLAKLLGIRVARNFDHPFTARNISEYWSRWHMSLTSWLTDYVFTPLNLAFRDIGKAGACLAIIIDFVLIGLWHGVDWTFALFGLYHGLLFVPLVLSGKSFKRAKLKEGKAGLPLAGDFAKMVLTYALVTVGLILFRAPGLSDAAAFMKGLAPSKVGVWGDFVSTLKASGPCLLVPIFLLVLLATEWTCRKKEHALQFSPEGAIARHSWLRICLYVFMIVVVMCFQGQAQEFIYFKF